MGVKELTRQYNKIDKNFGSEGRNLYKCKKGHYTLTRHKDKGVTPMFIQCNCGVQASSMRYSIPQQGPIIDTKTGKRIIPIYYKFWVRPSLKWMLKRRNKQRYSGFIDHVLRGGLLFEEDIKPVTA